VVTAVEPTTGNAADLRATFSIKGVTAPVPLPVQVTVLDDGAVRVSAKTEVDRAQFRLGLESAGHGGQDGDSLGRRVLRPGAAVDVTGQ